MTVYVLKNQAPGCHESLEGGCADLPCKAAKEKSLQEFNHAYIGAMLSMTGGNITHAAKKCGLERQALVICAVKLCPCGK